MATYIDLNPVRAILTDEPGSYRWSGSAEGMSEKAEALESQLLITVGGEIIIKRSRAAQIGAGGRKSIGLRND